MRHRSGSAITALPAGAVVMSGRVVDVDPLRWTCRVRTEIMEKNLYDVQISSVYAHPLSGEGIHVMPEIGALVQICKPSEGDAPWFLLNYRSYPSRAVATSTDAGRPSAAGQRPRLAPGDIAILGRERNGLYVRRGQVTEIFGGPLARTFYMGRSSEIHTLCKSLKTDTFGGSVRWEVDRPEADPDGHQRTRIDVRAKEYSDDRAHAVRIQIGGGIDTATEGDPDGASGTHGPPPSSTGVVNTPVIRLQVYADGDQEEDSLSAVSSLAMDKEGQVELVATGTVSVESRGSGEVTSRLNPDGSSVLTTGSLSVTQTSSGVSVGSGAAPVLFDRDFSANAAAAWAEVSAIAKVLGVPTVSIDRHIAALTGRLYTAGKLETD